jgi:hypothetical protein
MYFNIKRLLILCLVLSSLSAAGSVFAASVGDVVNFNVDKSFDINNRTQLQATLVKATSRLYFYVDKTWWDSETLAQQSQISINLDNLSNEFDNNIYPKLISTFGSEWNPGIDKDSRITILFEPMNSSEGGYFREADEYGKTQMPTSNEREMFYLGVSNLNDPNVKVVLAHEFVHLITFNQKNNIYGVEEDTWLNEARADYSSTILGYDDNYEGSNLQQRVGDFVKNPTDSITDWPGTKYDYASVSLFAHYLVDHYGINILSNSLKSRLVGIESMNQALLAAGTKDNFSQIFTNWTIALVLNDCSQNIKYCYSNQNLKSLRISPSLIFLPLSGDSSLSSSNTTRNWAGNWQKIIGGSGNLKLSFSSLAGSNFQVPYIVYDKSNNYLVKFLTFNTDKTGEIVIQDFGTDYNSLIIVPSLQKEISGFDGLGITYPYSFTVSITGKDSGIDQTLIQKLLAQIDSLKKQIAAILAQRAGGGVPQASVCQITKNLSYGMYNSVEVRCLQTFLKSRSGLYYGLITGYFGPLTKASVIKFQQQNGLSSTGIVDEATRNKINQSW